MAFLKSQNIFLSLLILSIISTRTLLKYVCIVLNTWIATVSRHIKKQLRFCSYTNTQFLYHFFKVTEKYYWKTSTVLACNNMLCGVLKLHGTSNCLHFFIICAQVFLASCDLFLFAGVLFALKVLNNHYNPGRVSSVLGLPISSKYACWVELLAIHFISPG